MQTGYDPTISLLHHDRHRRPAAVTGIDIANGPGAMGCEPARILVWRGPESHEEYSRPIWNCENVCTAKRDPEAKNTGDCAKLHVPTLSLT